MLTARGRPEDVLRGFEAGADDYLPKPFELAILLARVRGLLRRSAWNRQLERDAGAAPADTAAGSAPPPAAPPAAAEVITFGGNTLDLGALELRVGRPCRIT